MPSPVFTGDPPRPLFIPGGGDVLVPALADDPCLCCDDEGGGFSQLECDCLYTNARADISGFVNSGPTNTDDDGDGRVDSRRFCLGENLNAVYTPGAVNYVSRQFPDNPPWGIFFYVEWTLGQLNNLADPGILYRDVFSFSTNEPKTSTYVWQWYAAFRCLPSGCGNIETIFPFEFGMRWQLYRHDTQAFVSGSAALATSFGADINCTNPCSPRYTALLNGGTCLENGSLVLDITGTPQ